MRSLTSLFCMALYKIYLTIINKPTSVQILSKSLCTFKFDTNLKCDSLCITYFESSTDIKNIAYYIQITSNYIITTINQCNFGIINVFIRNFSNG